MSAMSRSGWSPSRGGQKCQRCVQTPNQRLTSSSAQRVTLVTLLLVSALLSACAPQAQIDQAHTSKAKLDQELTHARNDLGIPDRLLAPITSQEKKVADGDGGLTYDYDKAAQTYAALYNQLLAIEQSAPALLKQQAQQDMQTFATILNQRRGEGFIEVPAYQARYDEAQQAFATAKTAGDYARVGDTAIAQTRALEALWPAYQKLQGLKTVIKWLSDTGLGADQAQQFYDQDLLVFRSAATAERYQALTNVIDAQIVQSQADAATAQPYIADAFLKSFQARIDLLKRYGDTAHATTFQQRHDDAAAKLANAHQPADYSAVTTAITQQNTAMTSLLIRAKARYDYQQFYDLAHQPAVANRMMVNKSGYDGGQSYPIAYEYLDPLNGHGDAKEMLDKARTDADFQAADFRATSLMANLRAMLDNFNPATDEVDVRDATARLNPAHKRPHPADLQLMQYYNVADGEVIVIALREQTARFYEKGKMVAFTYVSTGRPGNTSIPGFWTAINRHAPDNPNRYSPEPIPPGYGDVFTAPDPAGTPGYYDPTPIHYDVAYHEFGYWLHDAWWRHTYGPQTNLPHRDPAAFNGGSHGCVNISYEQPNRGVNMEWVYRWTPLGTPIIIY